MRPWLGWSLAPLSGCLQASHIRYRTGVLLPSLLPDLFSLAYVNYHPESTRFFGNPCSLTVAAWAAGHMLFCFTRQCLSQLHLLMGKNYWMFRFILFDSCFFISLYIHYLTSIRSWGSICGMFYGLLRVDSFALGFWGISCLLLFLLSWIAIWRWFYLTFVSYTLGGVLHLYNLFCCKLSSRILWLMQVYLDSNRRLNIRYL